MKKVFAVFLAVCILASLGISAFADAADYPWGASGSQSVRVVISDGLVNVPAAPFAGMKNITSVMLPASVVNIEGAAFGDSVIAEVRTVGDPEVLEGVKAFENAEIIQISQDEFDAAVKEIADNPTEVGDKGSYIISGTSLLIRLFEKLTVPAAPFWLYGDEGSTGGTSENGGPIHEQVLDELGRPVRETYYYSYVTLNIEYTYNSDDPDAPPATEKLAWEEPSGAKGLITTTYNEKGIPTEQTQTWDYNNGGSGESKMTFGENGTPAEESSSWTSPDGSSGESTTKYNENGKPAEESSSWTNPDGSSSESTTKYNENGKPTEESSSWTDKDGNTVNIKYEYKYNADASQRKVTYSDSNSTKDQVWWEKLNDNGEYITDDSINSPE